ncbi:type II secretion system major pseudopilin GspG [Myxococcaceae bacterium GXIMD 01537]
MKQTTNRKRVRGMTLIEIMVVITILGLIATAVGVAVMTNLDLARKDRAALDIKNIHQALDLYKTRKGQYPATGEGLRALVDAGMLREMPRDPWGHDYVYTNETSQPVIVSFGADGQSGGSGDGADISSKDVPPK